MVFRSPIIARPALVPKLKPTMSILSQSSGLPFEFTGSYEEALARYGQRMVDRVNFERGRVRPSILVNVFGGLFSGNAIAPPRNYQLRLQTSF
jgi:hypothetical protein